MSWPSDAELDNLVTRFHARTLPKPEWTHEAHLAVGAWHVHAYGPEQALPRLRDGITLLNDAHGTANTDTGGYHETMTRAYVALIAEFLRRAQPDGNLAARTQTLLASALASRDALLAFYSKARLFSVDARREWVGPDLAPLSIDRVLGVAQ